MKRLFIALFSFVIIVVLCVNCMAESGNKIEFSSYEDADLLAMLDEIYGVLQERNIKRTAAVSAGMYICGRDFPAGGYDITVPENSEEGRVDIDVYSSALVEMMATTGMVAYPDLVSARVAWTGKPFHVNLSDGDKLVIYEAALLVISNPLEFK